MTVDVAVVGSANLDLVATTHRLPAPGETVLGIDYAEHAGGKGLNQAVAAARAGASVALVAAVGDDDAGTRLLALAADEGIDIGAVDRVDTPTGRALITVDTAAENSIVVVPGANARLAPPGLPPCRAVLCQLEVPVDTVAAALRAGRRQGAITVLNPAPGRALDRSILADCDVVVPNEHELDLVGGLETLFAAGVGAVVVTRGAAGVDVTDRPGHTVRVAAHEVDAVDTTGAGDAFCGWLAARLAAGDELADAVELASAAGALATTVAGAVPSLPRLDAVRQLAAAG